MSTKIADVVLHLLREQDQKSKNPAKTHDKHG